MIIRMRIWGKFPNRFAPMTYEQIAEDLKCRVKDVKAWEQDAIWNVKQYLNKTGIVEIGEKFNKDRGVKDLLNPQKRIII